MDLPSFWLPRPPFNPDGKTLAGFASLLSDAVTQGPDKPITYTLAAPKWQFLCYVAEQAGYVLHGSNDPSIERFDPRRSYDSDAFGDRTAVYAASDGIWPMFFATINRDHPLSMVNSCSDLAGETYYYFSISRHVLDLNPWREGTVYLLPAEGFEHQPPIRGVRQRQAAKLAPVEPAAKIRVSPEEFPFLSRVRGHDDATIRSRSEADPDGFPWIDG
ncbi:hypothetical protein FH608_031055 [Nonomuraea phyllanthi]|uniref:Uncharacterized protein n=1 Tax=Nonomuraea phyllanthi TaxID=2219224 RepID=A0A5C4VJA4_9ACTN|nr:hypothetical protein [Nonomuraea phyllanthi]KAB8191068.1 hypothetical protein FH608_031055 [Nonomuraea phyllanthi]